MDFATKLRKLGETIGLVSFFLLAFIGLVSVLRGDLQRPAHAQVDQPQPGAAVLEGAAIVEANATLPAVISYQGDLYSAAGQPLEGTYNLTFRIYDAPAGGNALYTEPHPNVPVRVGRFVPCWATACRSLPAYLTTQTAISALPLARTPR